MERNPVSSSQIASVGFDRENKVLEVEFHNGGVYHYEGVPEDMADAFVKAPSMGQFLHQHIKDKFTHRKGRYLEKQA